MIYPIYDTTETAIVLRVLRKLNSLKSDNFFTKVGLCCTCDIWDLHPTLVSDLYESWEHYSGNNGFPVPAPGNCSYGDEDYVSPSAIYNDTWGNMCDPKTEYGRLRINLAEHCIKFLTTFKENGYVHT